MDSRRGKKPTSPPPVSSPGDAALFAVVGSAARAVAPLKEGAWPRAAEAEVNGANMAAAGGRLLVRSSAAGCRGFSTRGSANKDPPTTFQPPPKRERSAFQPPSKPVFVDKATLGSQRRFLSPEFIPRRQRTAPFKFYVERLDMIQRRKVINIPEFYVGSILSVTTADPYANGKTSRFVGICIQRGGNGLGGTFILRNVIEGQGVEICYELYNPRIQEIQVLKLEKRLDDNLMYLRDALPQYSTFDVDMKPVHVEAYEDVPVNTGTRRLQQMLAEIHQLRESRITLEVLEPSSWETRNHLCNQEHILQRSNIPLTVLTHTLLSVKADQNCLSWNFECGDSLSSTVLVMDRTKRNI
uniref:Large ribosomal subunit protein bL19m n=1 Tax=Crocodylus porosus TaxID=8502 RepID=A0A7M4EA43_CROPO